MATWILLFCKKSETFRGTSFRKGKVDKCFNGTEMRKGLSCIGLWLCLLLIIGCSNSDSQPENVEVYLEANTDRVLLKEEGGTAYINIASNTRWTILVEMMKYRLLIWMLLHLQVTEMVLLK